MNVNHDGMKNILFVQNPSEYRLLDSYMGYISEVSNREDLYAKLSESLCFPDYFGKNWDALCELYLDFYWIDTLNIVIIHENLSKLSFDDFRMYISIVLYRLLEKRYRTQYLICLQSKRKKANNGYNT